MIDMTNLDPSLVPLIQSLRLVVFDFDGVFTTNQVIVNQDGVESVVCNRSDGLGLRLLKAVDLENLILSMEANPVVVARARKLKMQCIHNCENKLEALNSLAQERGISLSQIAFVGNDINDVESMYGVGVPVAVQDAYPEAKKAAKWVLSRPGGSGAIREFCEVVARVRMGLKAQESPWEKLAGRVYEKTTPIHVTT